jgi:hypothetical protein
MQYVILSSQEIVTGRFPDSMLQVYETTTQTLKFTMLPDLDGGPTGQPIWRPNEDRFFVLSDDPIETLFGRSTIIEVRVDQGFQQNTLLQQALFAQFGPELTLDGNIPPMISPSDNLLAFTVTDYNPAQLQSYLVVQNLNTASTRVICTPTPPSFEFDRLVWSPDDRFVGYNDSSMAQVVLYDVTDGVIYRIPAIDIVGWLPILQSPRLTETPTNTPTSTPSLLTGLPGMSVTHNLD